ncbi:hypothetical protein ACFLX2_00735 [Candidatus Dependentiae bacterium]
MNSIVQEASSIAKAVQLAWEKASKPQRFSVRVFEEAEKNFFGITTKPAKIALLFEKKDVPQAMTVEQRKTAERHSGDKPHRRPEQKPRAPQKQQEKKIVRPQEPKKAEPKSTQAKNPKVLWTDEMVAMARNWMKDLLAKQNKQHATFTTDVKRYHMKFVFDKPIFDDEAKQKNLFRNAAFLVMQSIRNRLKKQLRYHKVVITSDK